MLSYAQNRIAGVAWLKLRIIRERIITIIILLLETGLFCQASCTTASFRQAVIFNLLAFFLTVLSSK